MKTLDKELIEMKDRATKVVARFVDRDKLNEDIQTAYFMTNVPTTNPYAFDRQDIQYTVSPSARNEVTGMHRLLKTTTPQFKVKSRKKSLANKIEKAIKTWWAVSGDIKLAPVHSDLALSAVMFSDVNMMFTAVRDLLQVEELPQGERKRLEKISLNVPVLFEALPAQICYPVYGPYGLSFHVRKYKCKGDQLIFRWGVKDGVDQDGEYTVWDVWDLERRGVWCDELDQMILFGEHGLPFIPISAAVSDGSEIFMKEEEKRQPFLYAKMKANMHNSESMLLTSILTSIYERGTGPLLGIDPTTTPDGKIEIHWAGMLRYIVGKVTTLNDKAFDADLLRAKELLDQLGGESTIYKQTLGENIKGAGSTFSGLAMLSQSGKLPLISPQNAVEKVIRNGVMSALEMIKTEGLSTASLSAKEIPDDLEIEVSMEVKLPQDMYRNAQIAAQLKEHVSRKWVLNNLMQEQDDEAMVNEIWDEKAADYVYQQMLPLIAPSFLKLFGQAQTDIKTGEGAADQEVNSQNKLRNEAPMPTGGPEQAMAGGEITPQLAPNMPGEEVI